MSKPANIEDRLLLKRLDSCSSHSNGNEGGSEKNDLVNAFDDLDEDDSLADFRSPPKAQLRMELMRNKRKAPSKLSKRAKKPVVEKDQPRIESSFFRPAMNDVKTAQVCPLCFKTLKDESSHTAHMKACAAKNSVSTKQLMDAMQLQERQAEERKALGLLSAPILQPKKPSASRIKKFFSNEDPELQLALAISESLHEAEQIEQIEEAELLAQTASQPLIIKSEEERRKTLQNFGFTTNKPVIETPNNKSKKRKLVGPTVLQTRSREEKERILTERIAEILTGEEALTQALCKESEIALSQRKTTLLKSQLLQAILKSEQRLWDRTALFLVTHESFYIDEISTYIVPSKKGSPNYIQNYDSNENLEVKTAKTNPRISNTSAEEPESSTEMEDKSVETLISNWSDTLNDSSFSDMIVFAKNQRQIWTHKLVFLVRCPNILNDVDACKDERFPRIKEQIVWKDTDRSAALAFLEFIYSGVIRQQALVFKDKELLQQVRHLARKYRVKELFAYLRGQVEGEEKGNQRDNDNTPKNDEISEAEDFIKESEVSDSAHARSCVSSPDMFDFEDENKDENEDNLLALLSLVNKEETLTQSRRTPDEEHNGINEEKVEETARGARIDVIPSHERSRSSLDLSAEIKRVQKDIDRSLNDLDSSIDATPLRFNMKGRKNLFANRWKHSLFSQSKDSLFSEEKSSAEQPKKTALTAFEESLLRDAGKDQSTSKDEVEETETKGDSLGNDSCLPESEIETDSENISMYSRYKKDRQNNSICKYREALKNLKESADCETDKTPPKNDVVVLSDTESETGFSSSMLTQRPMEQDSDTDEMENPPIRPRKRSLSPLENICKEDDARSAKKHKKLSECNVSRDPSPIMICSDSEDSTTKSPSVGKTPERHLDMESMCMETPAFIRRDREITKRREEKRGTSLSPKRASSDTRTLKVKAISDLGFLGRQISQPTRKSESSTPDFKNMDEPKLQRELENWGLKPQKVERAILLLESVYETLDAEKARSSEVASSSSDDESSTNKCKKSTKSSDFTAIAKKKPAPANSVNIKDAFKNILNKNRDLYNKILVYEPIKLELFRAMLKEDGFKCKTNELIDYLDQECITFTTDRRPDKRRKEKTSESDM